MNRKGVGIISAAAFVAAAAVVLISPAISSGQAKAAARPVRVVMEASAAPSSTGPKPLPLIYIDDELGGYLRKARELIGKKEYAQAIEILVALLGRSDQPFVPTSDPRLYVSLGSRTSDVIGQLPPDGLKLYRRLFDPMAERLYRGAAKSMDTAALRKLIRQYRHTSHGEQALNLLGAIHFDRREFSQAANRWRDILRTGRDEKTDPAVLLAKIAIAHHYGGEARRAEAALAELAEKHPEAEAVLGGRKQNVLAFARRALESPPPRFAAVAAAVAGWSCVQGSPDGIAVMKPCRPVLSQRWVSPDLPPGESPIVQRLLGLLSGGRGYPSSTARMAQVRHAGLQEGHLAIVTKSGSRVTRTILPAMIHPVVAGGMVLYRSDEHVVAHDLLTGREEWRSLSFAMHEQPKVGTGVRYNYYGSSGMNIADDGRYTLCVGGGKVYAVGRFIPPNLRYAYTRTGQRLQISDASQLAAFSLSGQLKLAWAVGKGQGGADILRACKFLGAPTYAAGRLYIVAGYLQAYYLICLDVEDGGRLIWSAMVGQQPIYDMRYGSRNLAIDRASPPAVADGRVFAVTNGGVMAAFEADTGRPIWAYQYAATSSSGRYPYSGGYPRVSLSYPFNPIIVAKGRAVVLPADCEQMLVLRVETGQLERRVDRKSLRDLTAVNESSVMLSGEGLCLIDLASGKVRDFSGAGKIVGRPAVTEDSVLASSRGELLRISLKNYAVSRIDLVEPTGILGNLVSVDGKLMAANAAGVAAYFPYESFRAQLTARIAAAKPAEVPDLLYRRGMNAFNATRPSEGLGDLLKAHALASEGKLDDLLAKTAQALYRTYVSLGNRASTDEQMVSLFEKAAANAYSLRSRGEMMVRMIKYHSRAGQPVKAVELAHRLAEECDGTDLVDVDVGDAADPYVRDKPETPRLSGRKLAQSLIKRLIERHGQSCYAGFDAKASAALTTAMAAGDVDAMVGVAEVYPQSKWAPTALLRAAETHYKKALSASGIQQREALIQTGQCLGQISKDYPKSELLATARVGRALVYKKLGSNAVHWFLRDVRKLPPTTRVSFAGVTGTLAEFLKDFPGETPRCAARPLYTGRLRLPLAKLYDSATDACILRGLDGLAVRHAGGIFILRGNEVSLFVPSPKSFADGVKWTVSLPLRQDRVYAYSGGMQYGPMAALSADGSTLLVAVSRGGAAAVDLKTRKLLWQVPAADRRISRMYSMAFGDDRLAILGSIGEVYVLDVLTGKELWRHSVPRQEMPWRLPPQIAGGLLLTVHGRSEWKATVFDMSSKKSLGTVRLARSYSQARLTDDGLLVVNDGQSLKLIEPVLGIDRPLWSLGLNRSLQPAIMATNDGNVLLSPNVNSGIVQVRSLVDFGRSVKSLLATTGPNGNPIPGTPHAPCRAWVRGKHLYLVTGSAPTSYRYTGLSGVQTYVMAPMLQAFDLTTGERRWAKSVAPKLVRSYAYVMPPAVGQKHLAVLVKSQSYNRPSEIKILKKSTGKEVHKIEVAPGKIVRVAGRARISPQYRHMAVSGPVMCAGKLVVETPGRVEVHGSRD